MSIELNDDSLLTPDQLAEYLHLKPKTLEKMRRHGNGVWCKYSNEPYDIVIEQY